MRSFQESLPEFEARGVRIAAISVDPVEINRDHCRRQGYTFPVLADPDAAVIRAWDLIHEGAGPDGGAVSRPAEFLLDATGTVRWVNLSGSYTVRARPAQVLEALASPAFESGPSR